MVFLDGIGHLATHLFVGDVALVLAPVIAQITQMDECRQHVVLATNDGHIVLESCRVNGTPSACQHIDDIVFQPLVVHVDVVGYGIKGTGSSPITAAAAFVYCLHHTIRVEHRQLIANLVAIIPLQKFLKVHLVLLGKCFDLVLGKSKELGHPAWLHHRIFDEVVQSRFGFIFLDG